MILGPIDRGVDRRVYDELRLQQANRRSEPPPVRKITFLATDCGNLS